MSAMRAIPKTVPRAACMDALRESLTLKNSCMRSWETAEAAARSWESAVDMVAARMPARMMPATIAKSTPFRLIRSAILMMTVSASELVVRNGIAPTLETL